jgi:hypothetical protein
MRRPQDIGTVMGSADLKREPTPVTRILKQIELKG